jgi:hypothetical protein
MSMTLRYAANAQGVLKLLHLFVKQVNLLLPFLFLNEPCAGYTDGWFGFFLKNTRAEHFPKRSSPSSGL